jgi:hypothetical protein
MKKPFLATLPTIALLGFATGAGAQGVGALDANGDGVLTIDEVQLVMTELTAEEFAAMDLNGDGALDEAEVEAAREAGLMPA